MVAAIWRVRRNSGTFSDSKGTDGRSELANPLGLVDGNCDDFLVIGGGATPRSTKEATKVD